jgi:ABC-2 type transport system permease protein
VSARPAAPGRAIIGPTALSGDLSRFVALTRTLAVQDFKLRFYGSALGYLWQLVRPLLLFGVLFFVFTQLVRLGAGTRFYAAVLLANIVMFTFLSDATAAAVTSVVSHESLLRKIQFPRLVVPLAQVTTATFNLALNAVVILIFALATGVRPHVGWLELLFLVPLLVALAGGLAMLLSALYVRFRDVKPIWDVLLQVIFYGSPILYPIETVAANLLGPTAAHLLMLNPFAAIIEQVRHAVMDPTAPSAAQAIGGGVRLLIPLAILIAIVALGFRVFSRAAPRLAEEL